VALVVRQLVHRQLLQVSEILTFLVLQSRLLVEALNGSSLDGFVLDLVKQVLVLGLVICNVPIVARGHELVARGAVSELEVYETIAPLFVVQLVQTVLVENVLALQVDDRLRGQVLAPADAAEGILVLP